jgi:hypothetical protein
MAAFRELAELSLVNVAFARGHGGRHGVAVLLAAP